MRSHVAILTLALICSLGALSGQVPAGGEFPPKPRPVEWDDCRRFSAAEFEALIKQLKTERGELDASLRSQPKLRTIDQMTADQEHQQLQKQLQEILERLRQRNAAPRQSPPPTEPRKAEQPKPEPIKVEPKKGPALLPNANGKEESGPPKANPADPLEPVDALTLAQALYRAEKYVDALAAFRKVDLKGKRASERAPIQYLTASCLQRLGKYDEALPLLRDVANSRGDEQLAEYAQWQIALTRWLQETRDQLQGVRQRRQALEKKL